MQRIPRHRLLAALLTFLSLIVVAMLPIGGVVSAASAATNCQPSEGGPICYLDISAPESVPAGQTFTVQVAVTIDLSRIIVAKSDPCARVTVNLSVALNEDPVIYMADTSGGIATFNVVVTNPGFYTLEATATKTGCSYDPDFAQLQVVFIPDGQPIAPCPDNVSCLQLANSTGSAATLFADTDGSFSASFIPFVVADGCGNLSPADPFGVLFFTLTDTSVSKTVIFALSSSLITNGIGRYNICWKSAMPFTPLGGPPQVTTGLLPNCKKNDAGPCVLFRTSGQHNVGFFGVRAPPGDPQAYPGS